MLATVSAMASMARPSLASMFRPSVASLFMPPVASLIRPLMLPLARSFSCTPAAFYDQVVLSQYVNSNSSDRKYFLDLCEPAQGERYLKLSERSRGKRGSLFVGFKDMHNFSKGLKAATMGKEQELVLGGEEFSMGLLHSDEILRVVKKRSDGKQQVVYLEMHEMGLILKALKALEEQGIPGSRDPENIQ